MICVGNLRDLIRSEVIEIVAQRIKKDSLIDLNDNDYKVLFEWYGLIRRKEDTEGSIAFLTDNDLFEISWFSYCQSYIPSSLNSEKISDMNPVWKAFYENFYIYEDIEGIWEELKEKLRIELVNEKWKPTIYTDNYENYDNVLIFKMEDSYYKIVSYRDSNNTYFMKDTTPVLQVYPKKIEIEIFEEKNS